MCLVLEGGDMTDLEDVPVCWGLRGCELGVFRAEVRVGGERTGDLLAVLDALGAGVLIGVEAGFRTGDDFAPVVNDLGVFADSETATG